MTLFYDKIKLSMTVTLLGAQKYEYEQTFAKKEKKKIE